MNSSIERGCALLIDGCAVVTPRGVIEEGRILIERGRIAAAGDSRVTGVPGGKVKRHSFRGCTAVPGFIDIHLHGAKGVDFTWADPGSIRMGLEAHLKNGTTACLPTLMTAPDSQILSAIKAIREASSAENIPEILGVNLEGPFISEKKRGVQDKGSIRPLTPGDFERYGNDIPIRIVTVAPELRGACELIRYLSQRGIIAAAGHTDATYDDMAKAIEAGIRHGTHLFNAMRGIFHREPGAAGALLLNDDVSVEIIADGEHLHPALLGLIARVKSHRRIIIVTDASPQYGIANGATRTGDGTLVGGTKPLPEALKVFLANSGLTFREGLSTITRNPAELLGFERRIGSIRKGADADIVILGEEFSVKAVFLKGRRVV